MVLLCCCFDEDDDEDEDPGRAWMRMNGQGRKDRAVNLSLEGNRSIYLYVEVYKI